MSAWAAAAAAASAATVALVSRRLATTAVSGPMVLVAAGLACGPLGLDLVDIARDEEAVKLLFEVALVAVLFTDAAGVRWSVLTHGGQVSRAAVTHLHGVVARFPNYNGLPQQQLPRPTP